MSEPGDRVICLGGTGYDVHVNQGQGDSVGCTEYSGENQELPVVYCVPGEPGDSLLRTRRTR